MLKLKIQTIKLFCRVSTALKVSFYWQIDVCLIDDEIVVFVSFYANRSHFVYIAHTWRAHDLFVFKQFSMVQWLTIARAYGHSSRRARNRLRSGGTEGEDDRTAIAHPSIVESSRSNYQGAKLSTRKCTTAFHMLASSTCFPLNSVICLLSCLFQYREERFRQTSESTNKRVLWWSLAQVIVLVSMGFWQMRHLKTFFETKKLVWICIRVVSVCCDFVNFTK